MSVRSTEGPGAGDDVGALPVDDPPAVEGLSAGRIAGAASLLSIGNVLSRILGLVRTQTIAHYFGTSLQADAFNFASKAPQTIYDLLVGGQLHGAIVPVLSDYYSRRRDEFWRA
ncbi:MAG TPA: lipid II flippase MurJ, partial [Anaerolineae bacterium]|nr:lipid II flippase MurJ [Anaerolineae bacterium]